MSSFIKLQLNHIYWARQHNYRFPCPHSSDDFKLQLQFRSKTKFEIMIHRHFAGRLRSSITLRLGQSGVLLIDGLARQTCIKSPTYKLK